MELLQKKDNRLGIIISIALHLFLLIAIFFSKGCMELQNPPQFTLEEVITLDFSDAGGGSPGSASPTPPTVEEEAPAEKVITQEESPVAVKSSNSTIKNENATKEAETKEAPKPKNDFSSLFGKGNGDSDMLDPDEIAKTYLQFHDQHRSAWAWEVELRPWVETF